MYNRNQLITYLQAGVSHETIGHIKALWASAKAAGDSEFKVRVLQKVGSIKEDLSVIEGFDHEISIAVADCEEVPGRQGFSISAEAADKLKMYFYGGVPARPKEMVSIDNAVDILEKERYAFFRLGSKPIETPEEKLRAREFLREYFYSLYVEYKAVLSAVAKDNAPSEDEPVAVKKPATLPEYFFCRGQVFKTSDVGFYYYRDAMHSVTGLCINARYLEKFKTKDSTRPAEEEALKWATLRTTDKRTENSFMSVLNLSYKAAKPMYDAMEKAYKEHLIEVERCKDKGAKLPQSFTVKTELMGELTINSTDAQLTHFGNNYNFTMEIEALRELGKRHLPLGRTIDWNPELFEKGVDVKNRDALFKAVTIKKEYMVGFASFFNKHASAIMNGIFMHKLGVSEDVVKVSVSANSTYNAQNDIGIKDIGFSRNGAPHQTDCVFSAKLCQQLADQYSALKDNQKDYFERAKCKFGISPSY